MNKKQLLKLIESLNLQSSEFTILSSGALVLRDILECAGDLDIAVTDKGLKELNDRFILKQKENGWYIVTDKIECVASDMKNKREKIGKYYVQDINDYLEYLNKSTREKDVLRIPIVEKYIEMRK